VLLFTTTAMMGMIERVFNQIWRVRRPRPLMQRMLIYWALITLGPLLFGLSISLTSQLFVATGGVTRAVPLLGSLFSTLASIALTTGAYTLLYVAVPNRYVDWRDALWGALVAAIAFELAKRLFAHLHPPVPDLRHHLRRAGRAAAVPAVDVPVLADHAARRVWRPRCRW
jgi:membrane protein